MGRHLHWKQAVMKKFLICIFICFSISVVFAQDPSTGSGTADSGSGTAEVVESESEIAVVELVETTIEEMQTEEVVSTSSTNTDDTTTSDESGATDTDNTPALEKKPLTLPLPERAEIERFRKQYLDPKWTQVLYNALEGAIDYRLYIRKELAEAGLPPELEYLPVVESNYKTNAKSRSGALGLWQFMSNSVKPFLTLNDYVDERLDPWKETDAAIKKLKENYDIFGDWLLAIGAYNCGAGAMTRALAKAEEKDFWYLCDKNLIPSQTQLYVPKLLAIADLALNCEYFEIDIPDHEEEYEVLYNETNAVFDYITVNKAYSITTVCQPG